MEETMSRKQKIIVSIVGIVLILLTLLGITYAYFLTKVIGNTNEESVIISTANLLLKYTDGNGILKSTTSVLPGTIIESKTFSVENQGTDVINNYGVYIENVLNEFERTQDVIMTVECKVYDTVNSKYLEDTCNGITDAVYPIQNSLIVTNSIAPKIRHDYLLKITYINETGIDQSNDMNKTIEGKIQIYDVNDSVDITGTILNATEGDYVVLGEEQQISRVINGKYKIVGLFPETYTIYLKNESVNENGTKLITDKGSITINVDRGDEEKLEDNTLFITPSSDEIVLDITSNGTYLILDKK